MSDALCDMLSVMKKSVIYIHGGDSFGNYEDYLSSLKTMPIRNPLGDRKPFWPDSLRDNLGNTHDVYMPSMPNKHNARYAEWKIWFERHLALVSGEVILVGWSLGGMFLAKYLSENNPGVPIVALYLLAAPSGEFVYDPKDGDCTDFTFSSADWATVGGKVPKIHIWHSEDDFVVPVAEANWYKKHLPVAELRIFKDKNHFLLPDLPEILESVRNL
jgi:uncharacterized protein